MKMKKESITFIGLCIIENEKYCVSYYYVEDYFDITDFYASPFFANLFEIDANTQCLKPKLFESKYYDIINDYNKLFEKMFEIKPVGDFRLVYQYINNVLFDKYLSIYTTQKNRTESLKELLN